MFNFGPCTREEIKTSISIEVIFNLVVKDRNSKIKIIYPKLRYGEIFMNIYELGGLDIHLSPKKKTSISRNMLSSFN